MVAVAIVGAAVVGGVASVSAADKASSTAQQNAATNNALQKDIYEQNKAALAPYQRNGEGANSSISALLGLGGDTAGQQQAFQNFRDNTGYQFRLNEGQKSVTSALGNKGLLNSGAAQKALLNYGQNAASAEYGNYYNALAGQQGVGLTAASAQAGVGQGYANSVTANNNNASNATANAALATGGAINGTLNSALSAYTYGQGMKSSYGAPVGVSPSGSAVANTDRYNPFYSGGTPSYYTPGYGG